MNPLTVVSVAVLLASSTWFAGTAVAPQLRSEWGLGEDAAAWLTSSTQLGFLCGTLLYSLFNVADRWSARRVFAVSAWLGAAGNLAFALAVDGLAGALVFRFLTGVTLAGVYPVGMRIVASWYPTGLGWRLGVMVGALGLGTSVPFLVRAIGFAGDWRVIAAFASAAALVGGATILTLADGQHLPSAARLRLSMLVQVFRARAFRLNAFGYFGHMWELYAMWSAMPLWLAAALPDARPADRMFVAFLVVAMACPGCVLGGLLSRRVGERRVAIGSLVASGVACLVSGFVAGASSPLVLAFVLVWGLVVVSDSPQFSSLAARTCPREYTGTALTIQNGVGFAVTIVSIQLLAELAASGDSGWRWAMLALAPGPVVGVIAMIRLGPALASAGISDHPRS